MEIINRKDDINIKIREGHKKLNDEMFQHFIESANTRKALILSKRRNNQYA